MADSNPELNDLVNVLSSLDWSDVQAMGVQLGMKLSTFRNVESERNAFSDRLLHSMDSWLSSDTVQPTWGRVVTALRASNKVVLANRVEQDYCLSVRKIPSSEPAPSLVEFDRSRVDSSAQSPPSSKTASHMSSHPSASTPRSKRRVQCNSPSPSSSSSLSSSPSSSYVTCPSSPASSPLSSPEMQEKHPISGASQCANLHVLPKKHTTSDQDKLRRVGSKASRLQEKFVSVLTHTKIMLSMKEVKSNDFLVKLRITLTMLPLSKKLKFTSFLQAKKKEIKCAQSTDEVFDIIEKYWNWSNYYLLQQVIKEFGDATLQKEMAGYIRKLHHFEKTTTIQIFSKVVKEWECPDISSEAVVTLQKDPSQITLYDLRKLKEDLAHQSSLNDCATFFKSVHSSEVVLTLAFPQEALELIISSLSQTFLAKHHIKSVLLDKMPLAAYSEEYIKALQLLGVCREGDEASLTSLLQSGVDLTFRHNKYSALDCASEYGRDHVVTRLLDSGADIHSVDEDGWSPLHLASSKGHTGVVTVLLDRGALPNAVDTDGWSPLHSASSEGHTGVVTVLLDRGALPNALEKDGWSPLRLASSNGHTGVVTVLLDRGAPPNAVDKDGWSALHFASSQGHTGVVTVLLDRGAHLNAVTKDGLTALMLATVKGHSDTVHVLTRNGADLNTKNEEGLTALMIASKEGLTAIVRSLVDGSPDVNILENSTGWSALFFAAKEGHTEIARKLISAGADITLKDKNGVTPLDVASVHGWEELCQTLSSAMPTPCPPPPKEEETSPTPQTTPQGTHTTPPPPLSFSEDSEQSEPHTTPTAQEGRNRPFKVLLNLVNKSGQTITEIYQGMKKRMRSTEEKELFMKKMNRSLEEGTLAQKKHSTQ